MSFAERQGFVKEKAIQLDNMDASLRNRLYNLIHKYLESSPFIINELKYVVDKLGCRVEATSQKNWSIVDFYLTRSITDVPWYMPYEILELFFEAKREYCYSCEDDCHERGGRCSELIWFENVSREINRVLAQEKAGYRFLDDKFVNITSDTEIEEIEVASKSPYIPVNTHLKKALAFYADRKNPDYENSIKESISAVEAICCIITGATGSNSTLGSTLKKLEDSGVVIHNAMKVAFEKLYGYASDSAGIRHGGIDFTNSPAEDAKYMLVSCSAFVNYLIEKHGKFQ